MIDLECLCIVLYPDSDPERGRLSVADFYLRGLVKRVFLMFKRSRKREKILIKNDINCFFPEKILFYLETDRDEGIRERIREDMRNLKVKKFGVLR